MPLSRTLCFVLLLLASVHPARAVTSSATADGERMVVVERYGFRIERPDDSWIAYASEGAAAGETSTLTLYPRDSQSLPSVIVYAADHDGKVTAEDLRASAVLVLEQEGSLVLDQDTSTVAGRAALSVRGRATTGEGLHYDFELHYFVAEPFVYALQCNWPADGARPDAVLDRIVLSFELFEASAPASTPEDERLAALAGRCGSQLPWCADWEEAAARARSEDKLVLVVFENFSMLDLPRTRVSGPLMDADLLALVQERFVTLRLDADDPAPFRGGDAYGMGSHTWGGSLLFVTPAGEVLDDVSVSNACLLGDRALRALDRAGLAALPARASKAGGKPSSRLPRDPDERLALAERHLRRGELREAEALLERVDTPDGHALRAALLRHRRQGEAALEEVASARRHADDALAAGLAVEEAVLLMRLARWDEAEVAFEAALERFPDGARSGEALFWLGAMDLLERGEPHGTERWRAIVEQRPEDPWAWKAAANLLGTGSFINGGERLDWPEPEVFAAAARPPPAPLDIGSVDQAERDAIAFLVAGQRPDGSWINPSDAFSVAPSGYTFAITAICGSSLLPYLTRDEAAALAVRRGLDYLLAIHELGQLDGGTDLLGVYSIWGRAFVLRFLSQCRSAHVGEQHDVGPVLAALVQSVLDSQHEGGGWPYVVFPNSPASGGLDPSASFLTAGVLLALLDARAAGTEVPQAPIDRALAFLQRMRRDDGSYRYMRDVPEPADNPEAAGRGPVCALAVHRGGEPDLAGIRKALDLFLARRDGLRRVWGRDLCHTGPQGEGAHYLFFDYGFAAAAVAELPRRERARYRKALLEDVLDVRDAEGAFADMPSLGRAYGTAMALFTFQQLSAR